MNGINVQTKGFETELLVINPNDYNVYTSTMVTFDSEEISELQDAQEFDVVLELIAEARSVWYSSAIKASDERTWA